MTDIATAEGLFERVWETSRTPEAAIALAGEHWQEIAARPACAPDAETCRLVMLAVLDIEPVDYDLAAIWRLRALGRFTQIGWTEGVAALMMGEAFRLLGDANAGYPNGRTLDKIVPSKGALAVIDELEPFSVAPGSGISVGPSSPTPSLIARFVHEKRGALLLVARDLEAARASYERALGEASEGSRGAVKVGLGLALVDYVRRHADGVNTGPALEATQALVARAEAVHQHDLVRVGARNITAMRRGDLALTLYELL